MPSNNAPNDGHDAFLNLPNVPLDLPDIPDDNLGGARGGDGAGTASTHAKGNNDNDEIDFDDLARRFEELTKRK